MFHSKKAEEKSVSKKQAQQVDKIDTGDVSYLRDYFRDKEAAHEWLFFDGKFVFNEQANVDAKYVFEDKNPPKASHKRQRERAQKIAAFFNVEKLIYKDGNYLISMNDTRRALKLYGTRKLESFTVLDERSVMKAQGRKQVAIIGQALSTKYYQWVDVWYSGDPDNVTFVRAIPDGVDVFGVAVDDLDDFIKEENLLPGPRIVSYHTDH